MNGAVNFVKAHPVATGASVLAIIAVVMVASSAGAQSSAPASGYDDSGTAAGLQMQALQTQAQLAAGETAAKLQLGLAQNATREKEIELQAQTTMNANDLAAQLADKGLEVQKYVSSLTSANEAARIANERANTADQYATIRYQSEAQIKQTNAILQAQVKQAEIAAKPKGLFSFLFG